MARTSKLVLSLTSFFVSPLTLAVTLIVLASACATGSGGRRTLVLDEGTYKSSLSSRRVANASFQIEVEAPRRLHIISTVNGQERYTDLDWPLMNLEICPNCEYASLGYQRSDGNGVTALLNIQTGEIIQNLGPTLFTWSDSGQFMAMEYAQRIEVIRTADIENYLGIAELKEKDDVSHRVVNVNPSAGKQVSLVGFYEDLALLFNLGCCEQPQAFGVDLEMSQIFKLECDGSDCKDVDELSDSFVAAKGNPGPHNRPADHLFELKP